jgi:hypothetical protein
MIEKNDDKKYAYLAAHLQTLELTKALLCSLKEQAVEAIVLKGIYLAVKFYNDLGRQPGSDVDILVKRGDVFKAKAVLNDLGWLEASDVLADLFADYGQSGINSLMFFSRESAVSIHLHWHIINTSWPLGSYVKRIDMQELWDSAVSGALDGAAVKELRPEHLLIYLCWHGFGHCFAKPVYSEDIKVALEYFNKSLDRDYLRATAEKWGVSWIVDYCVEFIKNPGIGRYDEIFWRFLVHENGLRQKCLFLYRWLFPRKSQIAMVNDLPTGAIGFKHYFQRIFEAAKGLFTR